MEDKQEPRLGRAARGAGMAAMAALCLLAGPATWAQPGYRPLPAGEYDMRHYPDPPSGFRGGRPYECDLYARDHADWYAPRGAGVGSGAVRGAIGGAVFGAVVGGGRGARRGAMAGGALGAVAAGARARQDREIAYRLAYDDCMQRFRR